MILRRHSARFAAALSSVLAFALVFASVLAAVTHVGHAHAHQPSIAHQHASSPSLHQHADATVDVAVQAQGEHQGHEPGCGAHGACDLFCHGAVLLPVLARAARMDGHDARNGLRPAVMRPATPTSLERPPRTSLRA